MDKYVSMFAQKRLLGLLSFKSCNTCGKNVYEQISTSTTKLHGKISEQLHTTLCMSILHGALCSVLHCAFSSWIEKAMTKTIYCHLENRFVSQ